MTDGNIQAARKKLQDAVERLLERRPWQHRDGTVYAPSLYFCLVSDLAGTQGDTRTPAKSLPPVWIDAMQLRQDIDAQVHRWVTMPGTTPWRLGILKAKSWRPQDAKLVEDMASQIDHWCETIISMVVAPEKKWFIEGKSCPSCSKTWSYRREPGGDHVRSPALKLVPNSGCICQSCKAFWPEAQFMFLAKLIGCKTPEGVSEEGAAS